MKNGIILSILALIAVFAALLIFSGDEEKKEQEAPPPTPEMARAPEPEAPPVEPVPEDPALKEALLGLNRKPAVEAQEEAPKKVRRRARPVARIEEEPREEPLEIGLSDYAFQSTVGSWSGVKSCLATTSQRGEEKLSGAIQVAFRIQNSGEVIESKVVEVSNDHAATVAPCVEKQARRIRFPAFAGIADVTKTAKFVF